MSEAAAAAGAVPGMAAAMAEARLRRKQLLSAEEAELFELAQAAGSGLDPEVFRVLLDLLRMNVAPLAVFQVLKSMCAGQRLPPAPEGGGAPPSAAPAPLPADTREPPEDGRAPPASALRPPRFGLRPPLARGSPAAPAAASCRLLLPRGPAAAAAGRPSGDNSVVADESLLNP